MKFDCIIVDDDRQFLNEIRASLNKLTIKMDYSFSIHIYDDPRSLQIEKTKGDIYIIDIDMPGKSGFELAHEITEKNPVAIIIFCTKHDELVYDSFKLNTFYFVRKDNLFIDLFYAMQKLNEFLQNSASFYNISTRKGVEHIRHSDILFFEVTGNDLYIHLIDNSERIERKTLTSVMADLNDDSFIQISQNYIVNGNYITAVKTYAVILKDGTLLDIPKTRFKQVKEKYIRLIMR